MTAFSGSSLYIAWVTAGATTTLQGNFRNFSYNPTLSLIDATAGDASFRNYIAGIGEGGDIGFSSVMQTNATALLAAVARSTQGTLFVGVEGTTTGKPKLTIPAISKGPQYSVPYDDVVTLSIGFQQSAAETESSW
jgi:hypothetical protein